MQIHPWLLVTLMIGYLSACAPQMSEQDLSPGTSFKDCATCPEMVVVPAGSFRMGDLSGDGFKDENPVHNVTIPAPLAIGKYEVSQAEWVSVMGQNVSRFKGDQKPVQNVRWKEARSFAERLAKNTGKPYRLLSEAEWEYAARANTSTAYFTGSTISTDQANFNGRPQGQYRKTPTVIGSFPPNQFGLHDMHGNVWEWTEDCYLPNYEGAPTRGAARKEADCSYRVLRGGAWNISPTNLRSANRYGTHPDARNFSFGFRVAREIH